MADIYGFGPGWDLPATVQENVKTLVEQHLAGNPSGDALVNQKLTALESGKADKVHTHTTGQVTGLDASLNQLKVDVSTAGAVKSVNGQTGNVVVDSTNVLSQDGFVRGRGILPDGADLNAYRNATDVGVWEMSASNTYSNSPITANSAGLLIVHQQRSIANQRVIKSGFPESWERSTVSSSAWNAWAGVNVTQLPAGADLDGLRVNNEYVVRNASDAANMNGWPTGVARIGARLSVRVSTTGLVYQQIQTYGAEPQFLIRSTASTTPTPYPFSAWVNLTGMTEAKVREIAAQVGAGAPVAVNSGVANALLLQDFTRRRPVVKTNGKPAVALRFDHGLKNFREMIVPHLKRLGLPAAICLNAGDWSRTENEGTTKEMVNAWVAEGWLEIWNHSLNHQAPPTDPVALEQQIKGGLDQLRLDLPAATIDGYMPPGSSGDTTGFEGGRTVEAFWNTTPGRMILQYHAVTSGYVGHTQYRTLDGEVRQGQLHYTVDTDSLEQMKARVTGAYAPVRGVNIMVHPSVLDTAGSATSATYVAFLEWLAAERDAGRLVVLGAYDLLRADATPDPVAGPVNVGERDITSLAPGVTDGKIYISRSGSLVTMQFDGVAVPADTASYKTFDKLVPEGFLPPRFVDFSTAPRASTELMNTVRIDATGRAIVYGHTGQTIRGVWTWRTTQAAPSVLPGVAV